MKIKEKDLELFKKINIKNCIDLALILPKKIENFNISTFFDTLNFHTQEVEILNVNFKNSQLFGSVKCKNLNIFANFVFFNASKWHINLFKKTKNCIFYSKMNLFNGIWQFINPSIIKESGIFKPKYQIPLIKDIVIEKLINTYVNYENLKESGLKDKYINLLLNLHKNDEKSFYLFNNLQIIEKDLKYIEIFNFLKRLKYKNKILKSYEVEIFDINNWINNLGFKLTNDQLKAIEDIKNDLKSNFAKRRVVMGDVGCGKTLVLLASALMVYPKQAILMAPTSILAEQLYNEAKKLLPNFMNVIFLKGGKKDKNLDEKVQNANLLIGTHALIYLKKHNGVLVMIDEQHRFGSNQRQMINDLAKNDEFSPHFLQFSATPIPRTLSMIQSEYLNFSFIKQMPFEKNIKTFCIKNDDFKILSKKIEEEISKNHQIIIVYPIVNESEKSHYISLEQAKDYWQKKYKNVYITHGKDKNKDEILQDFKENGNILLTTTLIEVGISLPRLSTIVIVGAEKFGLATLHQLRGRVGRNGIDGYCYLYTKLKEIPNRLIEFSNTLDGFKIAELDLKNRLSGDLLDGYIQHGNSFKFFDFAKDFEILKEAKNDLTS